tara:strand:+ start:1949 stop:2452 length:504 start_codon:yes stop_codon:yes gene_type:complete
MAYNSETMEWEYEDPNVAGRVTELTKSDSPYMTAARTRGIQSANRRGLLNSSIAGQAGEKAAIDAALPIASQTASQINQTNLAQMGITSTEGIARMNVAAHDREKSMAALAAMENVYGEAFRTVASQYELPADARNSYLEHLALVRDQDFNLVEQLYGIDLEWGTPG